MTSLAWIALLSVGLQIDSPRPAVDLVVSRDKIVQGEWVDVLVAVRNPHPTNETFAHLDAEDVQLEARCVVRFEPREPRRENQPSFRKRENDEPRWINVLDPRWIGRGFVYRAEFWPHLSLAPGESRYESRTVALTLPGGKDIFAVPGLYEIRGRVGIDVYSSPCEVFVLPGPLSLKPLAAALETMRRFQLPTRNRATLADLEAHLDIEPGSVRDQLLYHLGKALLGKPKWLSEITGNERRGIEFLIECIGMQNKDDLLRARALEALLDGVRRFPELDPPKLADLVELARDSENAAVRDFVTQHHDRFKQFREYLSQPRSR